jgi:hypothetical protein
MGHEPPHECRGLYLASTAIQTPGGAALVSSTDTSGQHDKLPALVQRGLPTSEPETLVSTTNVLPQRGFSLGTPYVQLEKNHEGEPSLSAGAECLSLHTYSSTNVRNMQERAPEVTTYC